jgi:hypothetical protein
VIALKRLQPLVPEDLGRIARERVEVPSLEDRVPGLAKARAEFAEIETQHAALVKKRGVHDSALYAARYRNTDSNDPEAVALQRRDVDAERAAINAIDAELPVLRRKQAEARARIDAGVTEARKLILDDVRPIHLTLLRTSFLAGIAPFADAIVAHEYLMRLLHGLEVEGVGFGNLPARPLIDTYLPFERLRNDARELLDLGMIKPADLPRG